MSLKTWQASHYTSSAAIAKEQCFDYLLHDDDIVAAISFCHAILYKEMQVALIFWVRVGVGVQDQSLRVP